MQILWYVFTKYSRQLQEKLLKTYFSIFQNSRSVNEIINQIFIVNFELYPISTEVDNIFVLNKSCFQ